MCANGTDPYLAADPHFSFASSPLLDSHPLDRPYLARGPAVVTMESVGYWGNLIQGLWKPLPEVLPH